MHKEIDRKESTFSDMSADTELKNVVNLHHKEFNTQFQLNFDKKKLMSEIKRRVSERLENQNDKRNFVKDFFNNKIDSKLKNKL